MQINNYKNERKKSEIDNSKDDNFLLLNKYIPVCAFRHLNHMTFRNT